MASSSTNVHLRTNDRLRIGRNANGGGLVSIPLEGGHEVTLFGHAGPLLRLAAAALRAAAYTDPQAKEMREMADFIEGDLADRPYPAVATRLRQVDERLADVVESQRRNIEMGHGGRDEA